ncbi:MAG: hypothetical protein ACOWWM_13350 [Desulfobacterales bacterium]
MNLEFFAALEASALARALRNSVWAYPLVNTGHILGAALLVGGIVPLDLRLLGLWPSVPARPLLRVLTRTAGAGLMLAVVFGALLFITRATEYVRSHLFVGKMAVVGAGVINLLVFHWIATRKDRATPPEARALPSGSRLAGSISLGMWLTALALGRLVGYF